MLKGVVSFLALTSIALAGYNFMLWRDSRPCVKPVAYHIGSFDTRFDVSKERFLSALAQAENVWESAIRSDQAYPNKELFTYSSENGGLPVNLIYDYRQEVTEELSVIERTVETGEVRYDSLERDYRALKTQYASLKNTYDSAVSAFNERSVAYEENIQGWNRGKRNSESEFASLEKERQFLEEEFSRVKSLESSLNTLVKEINATVLRLNALAKELNLNVEEYNAIGASRGETFAGGTYTLDQSGERIDIFEFENDEKLVRVLAHELGHALGLDHVDDPKAIMYYLNVDAAGQATAGDIAALKLLCGVE